MISAWWLLLIVPASACVGCRGMGFLVAAALNDAEEEAS